MIYIIDASVFIFRAWYSIPDTMTDADRNPVNAVYGFARFLGDFLESVQPRFVAVAFDRSLEKNFRRELYPQYKANREPAPPELRQQFRQCQEITRALGLMECANEGFEADDLIGTIAASIRKTGHRVTILTRDKDLVQVLQAGDTFWDYAGRKKIGYEQIPDTFGVLPEQMADFLALCGDSVDNIPGVPGVGRKTAMKLLQHFESVDDIYRNLHRVAEVPVRGADRLGDKLVLHKEGVHLFRTLTRIRDDVPIEASPKTLERCAPDLISLEALYDDADFGSMLRRQAQRISAAF